MTLPRFASLLVLPIGLSCSGPEECDRAAMLRLVNEDIVADRRSPKDYKLAAIEDQKGLVYIGMSQLIDGTDTFYRRHYLLDPRKCEIADVQIDQ